MPRLFVDWSDWWAREGNDHRLYLSAHGSAWDDCCHRQICTDDHAPYPELSLLAPYMRLIRSRGTERPSDLGMLDHPWLHDRRPPLYFDGPVAAERLVYVDLVRAYWSIYTRTTLDVIYDGFERGPLRGGVDFLCREQLGEKRLLRNALLGSLRRTRRRGIDHGEPFVETVPASARRPNLWGLVMDVLELCAWTARNLGAVYVHTDGYIFAHQDLAEDCIDELWHRYHIEATIRGEGEGIVLGLGRWRIGEESHGVTGSPANPPEPGRKVDSMAPLPGKLTDHLRDWLYHASVGNAVSNY